MSNHASSKWKIQKRLYQRSVDNKQGTLVTIREKQKKRAALLFLPQDRTRTQTKSNCDNTICPSVQHHAILDSCRCVCSNSLIDLLLSVIVSRRFLCLEISVWKKSLDVFTKILIRSIHQSTSQSNALSIGIFLVGDNIH